MATKILSTNVYVDYKQEQGSYSELYKVESYNFTGRIKYYRNSIKVEMKLPFIHYRFGASLFGFILWVLRLNPAIKTFKTVWIADHDVIFRHTHEEVIVECQK